MNALQRYHFKFSCVVFVCLYDMMMSITIIDSLHGLTLQNQLMSIKGYYIWNPEGGRMGRQKQKCVGRGRRNFPLRPPQDFKWNSPYVGHVSIIGRSLHTGFFLVFFWAPIVVQNSLEWCKKWSHATFFNHFRHLMRPFEVISSDLQT